MSNYTAKRRSGGGQAGEPVIAQMTAAVVTAPTTILITYNKMISSSDFTIADWLTNPGGVGVNIIFQASPTQLQLEMSADVTSEATITYDGTRPNTLDPQTIALT